MGDTILHLYLECSTPCCSASVGVGFYLHSACTGYASHGYSDEYAQYSMVEFSRTVCRSLRLWVQVRLRLVLC